MPTGIPAIWTPRFRDTPEARSRRWQAAGRGGGNGDQLYRGKTVDYFAIIAPTDARAFEGLDRTLAVRDCIGRLEPTRWGKSSPLSKSEGTSAPATAGMVRFDASLNTHWAGRDTRHRKPILLTTRRRAKERVSRSARSLIVSRFLEGADAARVRSRTGRRLDRGQRRRKLGRTHPC